MSFVSIVILQVAVLAVVLESDLGRRKIGWLRILRPVITVIIIAPFFFTSLPTGGEDLLLQGAGAAIGIALGLLSVSPWVVQVTRGPRPRTRWPALGRRGMTRPGTVAVSRAGFGYAAIWVGVSALRLAFAYSAQHVFPDALGSFLSDHRLTPTGLTNALIFLAVGMDLSRSAGLVVRGRRVLYRRASRDELGDPAQQSHATA